MSQYKSAGLGNKSKVASDLDWINSFVSYGKRLETPHDDVYVINNNFAREPLSNTK
mgnify:CR=1 FL=1